jgi:chlorobactene glucosyltransferase
MTVPVFFGTLMLVIGLYATVLSIANVRAIRNQTPKVLSSEGPLVSVLIPARNEELSLAACIESLTKQSYRDIEILVLDDESTDRTWEIIKTYEAKDPRVRGIKGRKLEAGWKGKTFAMQQLSQQAKGEYILFTDADTVHTPTSVAFGYSVARKNGAALVSGYPTENCPNWAIGTIISAMLVNTVLFVPLALQKRRPHSCFSMAIGQYLFVKRSDLIEIDGFNRFRNAITDDIHLARELARNGRIQLLVDASDALSCTMYRSTKEAFLGVERSLAGTIPLRLCPLILVAVVLLIGCAISPIMAIVFLAQALSGSSGLLVPAILTAIGALLLFGTWAAMAKFHKYSASIGWSGPVTLLWICAMYLHGLARTFSKKGFSWKGREI